MELTNVQYLRLRASDNLKKLRPVFNLLVQESEDIQKYDADEAAVISMLTDEKRTFIIAALHEEEILGVFIVTKASLWFNPKYQLAQDLLVWVHPDHRNSMIFIEMLERVEYVVKNAGFQSLKLGQVTGIDPERVSRLYKALGYRTIGFSSIKEL